MVTELFQEENGNVEKVSRRFIESYIARGNEKVWLLVLYLRT